MAKLKKTSALLTILAMLVGVGPVRDSHGASAQDWNDASESSAATVTAGMNPFDGRGLIDGVFLTSAAASQAYVEIRDSDTVNTSYEDAFKPIAVVFFSTDTSAANLQPVGRFVPFPRPIRVYRGLVIRSSNCPTAPVTCYSVQFRRVSEN